MVLRLKWIFVTTNLVLWVNAFAADSTIKKESFKKKEVVLIFDKTKKKILVELAETEAQHEQGLMFRKSLGKNQGMLFIFQNEDVRYFWMKNTIIDLSIGYFDKNKKLIDIQEMKATSVLQTEIPNYPSKGPAQYALEMEARWFSQNKVKEGATLQF